ncbi:MAG: hypothetical protein HC803_10740 [Saprospiraceae bacterium]|nr:hypothetical protein [Saprospiraceae bacterium]
MNREGTIDTIPYISCDLQCGEGMRKNNSRSDIVIECYPYYNTFFCSIPSNVVAGYGIDTLKNLYLEDYGNHWSGELDVPFKYSQQQIWTKEYLKYLERHKTELNECLLKRYENIKKELH